MDYSTDIWSASSTLTWLKGSHSLRMGPEFRIYSESNLVSQFAPTLDFAPRGREARSIIRPRRPTARRWPPS